MEVGLRNQIMRVADDARARGERIDLPFLLNAAASVGPIDWRLAAELARLSPSGDGDARAPHLLEFVHSLARSTTPGSILDPWVTVPALLAAARDGSGAERACGLVPDERLSEVVQYLPAVDWRRGDPAGLLQDLAGERFDLVLVDPPLGARPRHESAQPGDPRGRVELADVVLWRAAQHLSATGSVLLHTTNSVLWVDARRRVWSELAQQGLRVQAVVSVEAAAHPSTSLDTSLVLFSKERAAELFVGRLQRGTSVPALVDNLVARRASPDAQLGALTSSETFRGWKPFILEEELSRAFGSSELRALGEIGTIRRLVLRPDNGYDPPPNCIFVPTLGFGQVLTGPPGLEGKKAYTAIEVQVDPLVARAEYVAGLLSSGVGKQLREALGTGAAIPHLSAAAAAGIRIPVPPLSSQDEAVRASAHLASMIATVERLRTEVWRHPENAGRLFSQLEAAANADPVRRWLETLPYPLASVLHRYIAQRDPAERVAHLLHFFEATAQFGCAVLISVLRQHPDLLEMARPDIARAPGPGRQLFDRADFGLWINLGRTLAKSMNRIGQAFADRQRLVAAADPAAELMARLIDAPIWTALDKARPIRNARAHGGLVTDAQVRGWLGTLEGLISETEQALGSAFENVDLVRVDAARFRNGVFEYPRAERLRGYSSVFEEFELRTRVPLESDHLAFVGRDAGISDVLPLLPLVRLGATTSTSRNASYFFHSTVSPGVFAYVSYHFEDQPRIEMRDEELQQMTHELTAPNA
jgi:hypothetical protein